MYTVALPGYEQNVKNYVAALKASGLAAVMTLEAAEQIGLGNRTYELVDIDA